MKVEGIITRQNVSGAICGQGIAGTIAGQQVDSVVAGQNIAGSVARQNITGSIAYGEWQKPTLLSIVVEDVTPLIMTLTYDIPLDETVIPDTWMFSPFAGNFINTLSVSGKTIICNLDFAVKQGDQLQLSYDKDGDGIAAKAFNGYPLESFQWQDVTNNVISKSDWFMPSRKELLAMYNELHLHGLGGFSSERYWSSTESLYAGMGFGRAIDFSDGSAWRIGKSVEYNVRACRVFVSDQVYNLRDVGETGGYIFAITDNGNGTYTYYEAASADQSSGYAWSNVLTIIGASAQGEAIGTGQANTLAIIGQEGHTDSGAKLCDDLVE